MIIKKTFTLLLFLAFFYQGFSQELYKVYFSDKDGVHFTHEEYFDVKTIERRLSAGIPLAQLSDYPLRQDYVSEIELITGNKSYQIRWFNLVFTEATESQLAEIRNLPFVIKIEKSLMQTVPANVSYETKLSIKEEKLLKNQILHLEGNLFHDADIKGQGMRIAIFDAGFPETDTSPAFEHIRKNNRIIKTYDFAKGKDFVYSFNAHGTMVLSCIAGIIEGKSMGLATEAEFLLARTEIASEPFSEEKNWMEAVEWADKNGADIINSSLGYTYHRYFTWQMDGETSLVARAANMAASKGILVVNAMGNDGSGDWKVLGTPADADSIISVGGIDPETNYHQSFSSFGPTSDLRMKPNVSAFSTTIVAGKKKLKKAQGTSFASPLTAGFAACAWQTMKKKKSNLSNMDVFNELQKSANLYPYFDYAHGYGVPQAPYFLSGKKEQSATFTFKKSDGKVNILSDKAFIMKEGKETENYLFVHVADAKGVLLKYWLVDVYEEEAHSVTLKEFPKGTVVRASFQGYTAEIKID